MSVSPEQLFAIIGDKEVTIYQLRAEIAHLNEALREQVSKPVDCRLRQGNAGEEAHDGVPE